MVNRCSNPDCRVEFDVFRFGDLYAYERHPIETEYFWLCANCAARYDLYLDPDGVALKARGVFRLGATAGPSERLRLVTRAARTGPRLQTMPAGERARRHGGSVGPV